MTLSISKHLLSQGEALAVVVRALDFGNGCDWFVDVPLEIKSTANLRQHWAVKAKTAARHRNVALLVLPVNRLPLTPERRLQWVIRLIRVAPRELDSDNLWTAFKALRDGIAERMRPPDSTRKKGDIDDRDKRVQFVCDQVKGKPARVRIEAYHVDSNPRRANG